MGQFMRVNNMATGIIRMNPATIEAIAYQNIVTGHLRRQSHNLS